MAFCKNCGAQVDGSFCTNCGTPVEAAANAPQAVLNNNVDVRARYTTKMQAMAGIGFYLFFFGISQVFCALGYVLMGIAAQSGVMLLNAPLYAVFGAVLVGGGILLYRPGLKSIRANTPEHLYKKTRKTFMLRSVLFIFAWSVSIMFCMFILGIIFGAWNIGIAATRPKEDNYTAFFNGQMIPVTKTEDWMFSSPNGTRYIFVDENGVFYRPPLSSNIK